MLTPDVLESRGRHMESVSNRQRLGRTLKELKCTLVVVGVEM